MLKEDEEDEKPPIINKGLPAPPKDRFGDDDDKFDDAEYWED